MENQKTKKPLFKRYARRQLLKDKASAGRSTNPAAENPVRAGISEEEEGPEDVEAGDGESGDESDLTEHYSDLETESDDPNVTTGRQSASDRSVIRPTNSSSGFEDADGGSRMGQITREVHSSKPAGDGMEDSESAEILEDEEYFVEEIRSSRKDINGKFEFLIKWHGQEKLDWEPEETLLESAPDAITNYFEERGGRESISLTPQQAKRKRGQHPKIDGPETSDKPSEHKKQKLESGPMIDKLDKITVVSDSGIRPDAEITTLPYQGIEEESDGGGTINVKQVEKRGRGRPRKIQEQTSDAGNAAQDNKSAKRGRGRPRKSDAQGHQKEKSINLGENGLKRGRGRPRKSDFLVPGEKKSTTFGENGVKRPRGRPRKSDVQVPGEKKLTSIGGNGVKRGRGRPCKNIEVDATPASNGLEGNAPKRGRGRPRKNAGLISSPKVQNNAAERNAKRGRGRPRKIKEPEGVEGESQQNGGIAIDGLVG